MKDYTLKPGIVLHGYGHNYTIERVLGNGTFGITYLASVQIKGALGSLDANLNVAIKEFFMRDFNGRDECSVTYSSKDGAFAYYKSKFIHEAENLSRLNNPGIIKVLELFEENQTAYYVMEYLPNGSLDEYIATRKSLPPKVCIDYAVQISEALKYMHDNLMLHLDLKPNNIMVNNNDRLVLIDFGLSKRFDQWGNPETSTTIGHGTPGYAPIEQAHYQGNNKEGFPASMDVYALGATMFKMLTGHRPPEASIILNNGFPAEDLKLKNIPEELIEVVRTCMEPIRKNRYKSMKEVIDVLLSTSLLIGNDDTELGENGFYKKATGDRAYGTYQVNLIPVTSSIKFPKSIKIRLWDNSQTGKSYELYLTDNFPSDGDIFLQNSITVWDKGRIIREDSFCAEIPSDVKKYIIKHGLLSTVHWENEESTTPVNDDFGTDVLIQMSNNDGETFIRRVEHAHKDWHSFLLEAVSGLLNTTSLADVVHKVSDVKTELTLKRFEMPSDSKSISVKFKPPRFGCTNNDHIEDGYWFKFQTPPINESSNCTIVEDLSPIIRDFNNLNIEVGDLIIDNQDYSEEPAELVIEIESGSKGLSQLSLVAFNTCMYAGNIYNANILDLAKSIENVLLKHIPKRNVPTLELIYSVPNKTSEIWIDYSEAGIVGLAKSYKFRIGSCKNPLTYSDTKYLYSPKEFTRLADGLRGLSLRSQESMNVEPATGQALATLTISLYDRTGNLIKKFYAQDKNNRYVGDVAISVDKLKDEIVKVSPSFKKLLNSSDKVNIESSAPISNAIFKIVLISIVIGIVALPTYFFAKPTDDLYLWLWVSLGTAELFSAILFGIGGRFNKSSEISNFETATFLIGLLGLVAYIVLWIFQMCYWWA